MTRPLNSDSTLDSSAESPTVWRNRLGRELRQLREERGLRLEDAAGELDLVASSLWRTERGQVPVKNSHLTAMFQLYGVSNLEQRKRLIDIARRGQSKGWWHQHNDLLQPEARQYLGLEAAASCLSSFSLLTIPSMIQTEEYASAVLAATRPDLSANYLQDLVWVQLHRQEVLRRSGCRLDLLIDESALLRTVGSAEVMGSQVEHVLGIAARPNVTVRLVSLQGVHPILTLPYTILTFAHPDDQAVVCHRGTGHQLTLSTDQRHVQAVRRFHATLARDAVLVEQSGTSHVAPIL